MVRSNITQRTNGTYTVNLSLSDDVDNIMSLDLMVAKEDMAKQLSDHFHALSLIHIYAAALYTKYWIPI